MNAAEAPAAERRRGSDRRSGKADAEAADAKDAETQTTAKLNETKPADEEMQDTNEELERHK